MAEEVRREQEDDSAPADKEQAPQNVEGNDAEADIATPEVKTIAPEDQTFWENSVDANAVDISAGETADSGTPPTEEPPPPAEEVQQPDGDKIEASTKQTEDAESTPPTPAPSENEGEEQPGEQEPVAEKEAGQGEPDAEGDTAAAASDEPQPKGKVLSFYRRLNKKTLIAGSGILLLIAGSIGFTLVPGLRSSDSITSTFLGGMPETAYDMKFFLPLDVGYEKSQFVKVTIALELMDEGLQKEIDKNISQLRKEVIDLILTKSPKEVKSSSGKKELSSEITSRINNYLLKDCIKNTYFTELVIL